MNGKLDQLAKGVVQSVTGRRALRWFGFGLVVVVIPVQPSFAAIEVIAPHWDSCSDWCSNTIRTARSRTSGEYRVALPMTPSSQSLGSPEKPGRFMDVFVRGNEGALWQISSRDGGLTWGQYPRDRWAHHWTEVL
jgi:hypothetical protein